MTYFFWILIFLVFYTYLGYGFIAYLLVKVKKKNRRRINSPDEEALPSVIHLIAAYNEEDCVEAKIRNSLDLDYPKEKYQVWVVTDGSNDQTAELVRKFSNVKLFHQDERRGKIHAVNRVMPYAKSEVVVFSDANTTLNRQAIMKLVSHYSDPDTGGVSGEKRIRVESSDEASSSGEGLYWKYESFLKELDSRLHSVVGAAGELFSIRTHLYRQIPLDTLIEDF